MDLDLVGPLTMKTGMNLMNTAMVETIILPLQKHFVKYINGRTFGKGNPICKN